MMMTDSYVRHIWYTLSIRYKGTGDRWRGREREKKHIHTFNISRLTEKHVTKSYFCSNLGGKNRCSLKFQILGRTKNASQQRNKMRLLGFCTYSSRVQCLLFPRLVLNADFSRLSLSLSRSS